MKALLPMEEKSEETDEDTFSVDGGNKSAEQKEE